MNGGGACGGVGGGEAGAELDHGVEARGVGRVGASGTKARHQRPVVEQRS